MKLAKTCGAVMVLALLVSCGDRLGPPLSGFPEEIRTLVLKYPDRTDLAETIDLEVLEDGPSRRAARIDEGPIVVLGYAESPEELGTPVGLFRTTKGDCPLPPPTEAFALNAGDTEWATIEDLDTAAAVAAKVLVARRTSGCCPKDVLCERCPQLVVDETIALEDGGDASLLALLNDGRVLMITYDASRIDTRAYIVDVLGGGIESLGLLETLVWVGAARGERAWLNGQGGLNRMLELPLDRVQSSTLTTGAALLAMTSPVGISDPGGWTLMDLVASSAEAPLEMVGVGGDGRLLLSTDLAHGFEMVGAVDGSGRSHPELVWLGPSRFAVRDSNADVQLYENGRLLSPRIEWTSSIEGQIEALGVGPHGSLFIATFEPSGSVLYERTDSGRFESRMVFAENEIGSLAALGEHLWIMPFGSRAHAWVPGLDVLCPAVDLGSSAIWEKHVEVGSSVLLFGRSTNSSSSSSVIARAHLE